jgi:hypothetical protein
MADVLVSQQNQLTERFKDMGDGTLARVIAIGGGGAPVGVTPVHAASANGANSQITGTLPAVAAKLNYISGFEVTSGGATAASLVDVTLTGVSGGTETFVLGVVAGAALPNAHLCVRFDPPLPASAVNTAITVTVPALGAGNTKARVNVHGFYQ